MTDNIKTVGVIGAGVMGAGIAQVFAASGFKVLLFDQSPDRIGAALSGVGQRLDRLVEKNKLNPEEAGRAKARLSGVDTLAELAAAGLVIEAIVENLDAKQSLFRELEDIVAPDAILASNTSSLSIAAIGNGCTHRDRICGLHFFNPVPLMKLVEVIPGPATSERVKATALAMVRRIGKISVVAKDGPGFLVNLGGRAFYTEALHIENEGVAGPARIDRIMREGCGFRMGPFELMDLTGIDVNFPVTSFIHEGHQFDPRLKTAPRHERMFEAGLYGRKVGRGFYDYPAPIAAECGEAPPVCAALAANVPDMHPGFHRLAEQGLGIVQDADRPVLVSLFGEDATTAALRLGVAPERLVALDFSGQARGVITLMTPPVNSVAAGPVAEWLTGLGYKVEEIADSPGYVAQRILAMIVNLGCEMAQTGVGSPADIEKAMKLGLNYPFGPLELGDRMGRRRVLEILENLQKITGSDRYRPSLWLRRRAQLGLSLSPSDPSTQPASAFEKERLT